MRKILGVVFAFVMILVVSGGCKLSYAIEQGNKSNVIIVESINQRNLHLSLSISASGLATITSRVRGTDSTKRIDQHVNLQRYDSSAGRWVSVKTWTQVDYSTLSSFSTTHSLSKRGKYRCQLSGNVIANGTSESFSKMSSEVTY